MGTKFKVGDWVTRNGKTIANPDGTTTGMMSDLVKGPDGKVTSKPRREVYWVDPYDRRGETSKSGLIMRRFDGVFGYSLCVISPKIEPLFDLATPEEVAAEIERCERLLAQKAEMGLGPASYLEEYQAAKAAFLGEAPATHLPE